MKKFGGIGIKIVSAILCVLICVSVFIGGVLVSVKVSIASPTAVKRSIISSGYGDIIAEDVKEKVYQYGDMTGISHDVFDASIDYSAISMDLYESVVALLNGSEYKLDTTTMRQNLIANIKNEVSSKKSTTNSSTQQMNENIEKLANSCVQVYADSVSLPLLKSFSGKIGIINKVLTPSIAGCLVVAAVAIISVILIQKWRHRGIRYIMYSLIGIEWMLAVIVISIQVSNIIKRINISSKGFYNFTNLLLGDFVFSLYSWIVVVAIMIGLAAIWYSRSKKTTQGRQN